MLPFVRTCQQTFSPVVDSRVDIVLMQTMPDLQLLLQSVNTVSHTRCCCITP